MGHLLPVFLLLLFAQNLLSQNNEFDIFYDQTNSRCHFQQADTIWVGCEGSLVKRLAPTGEVTGVWDGNNSPLQHGISDVWVDAQNRIWMALGDYGAALKDDDAWTMWTTAEVTGSAGDAHIYSIGADENGKIWAYDREGQLIYWYENGAWQSSGFSSTQAGYNVRFLSDPQGQLWWLNDAGVHRFQNGMWQHYQAPNTGFCGAQFRHDGRLIAATQDGRLLRFQPNGSFSLMAVFQGSFLDCSSIALDTTGKVYVASGTTVRIFTGSGWETYYNDYFTYNDDTPRQISADNYGNVWMSRYNYGILQKFSNGEFTNLTAGIVGGNDVCSDESGENIWFNTLYFISRLHVPTMTSAQYDPGVDLLYDFAPAGPGGKMWLCTSEGLYHFDGDAWQAVPDPAPGAEQHLYSIAVGAAGEVLGINSQLIKIYRPATNTWEHYPMGQNGVPDGINWSPFREPNGRLWFPGWQGISSYYLGEWTWLTPANSGMPYSEWYRVAVTPDGRLWATREDVLYSYDGVTWTPEIEIPCYFNWNQWFSDLFVDSRGWLWVTKGCGNVSVFDGTAWQHFTPANSNLPGFGFRNIAEDLAKDIWIGADPAVRYRVGSVGSNEGSLSLPETIHLSPNPATGDVQVQLPGSSGTLEVSDAKGRVLRRLSIESNTALISREGLPTGIYFVRFTQTNGRIFTQKLFFF